MNQIESCCVPAGIIDSCCVTYSSLKSQEAAVSVTRVIDNGFVTRDVFTWDVLIFS